MAAKMVVMSAFVDWPAGGDGGGVGGDGYSRRSRVDTRLEHARATSRALYSCSHRALIARAHSFAHLMCHLSAASRARRQNAAAKCRNGADTKAASANRERARALRNAADRRGCAHTQTTEKVAANLRSQLSAIFCAARERAAYKREAPVTRL